MRHTVRMTLGRAAGAVPLLAALPAAHAFGPEGHLIAGMLAERDLCPDVRTEIAAIDRAASADLRDFPELGLWADRIRSADPWKRSGPWHYMNIESRATTLAAAEREVRAFRHPPEGDVLEAIARFESVLADRRRSAAERADALRFVVHFVVDLHQPLHVGRAGDRGGNEIDVRYDGKVVSLHRFWDTDVIDLAELSPARYARRLAARERGARPTGDAVLWAAESLLDRRIVYAGLDADRRSVQDLSADYVAAARQLTERRLIDAGSRLAATLNGLWCR